MPRPGTRSARPLVAASALSAVACVVSVVAGAPAQARTTHPAAARHAAVRHTKVVTRRVRLGVTGDTYVSYATPRTNPGHLSKLVASDVPGDRKVTYLKFHVQDVLPRGAHVTHARIVLTRDLHHLPSTTLTLRRVRSVHWRQSTLTAATAPHRVGVARRRRVNSAHSRVGFPVTSIVRHNRRYAFAVTSSNRSDVARFQSREAADPPLLALTYRIKKRVGGHPAPPKPKPTPPPTHAPGPPPAHGHCHLTPKLVPSCGVLFGGALSSFGGNNAKSEYDDFNAQSGTHVVLEHDYRRPGQVLSSYDVQVAQTPGAILQLNWKPASSWSAAGGDDSAVNSQIDAMARSIKSLGNTKIFLTIWHEPENDVSSGAKGCPSSVYKGHAGTPREYRLMWANVERRFHALGVNNVVWDMNYMNYSAWDCMINALWPGNKKVNWVFFESYAANGATFNSQTGHFYNLLTRNSNAQHNYLAKPWGIGEFGTDQQSDAAQENYYMQVKAALDRNTFPRLRLLSVFDYVNEADFRVAYNYKSAPDSKELSNFDAIGNDPAVKAGDNSVAGG